MSGIIRWLFIRFRRRQEDQHDVAARKHTLFVGMVFLTCFDEQEGKQHVDSKERHKREDRKKAYKLQRTGIMGQNQEIQASN